MGCWSSLPSENSTAGWLEKLRKVGEVPRVLPKYGGSIEWHVPLGVRSLTSCFAKKDMLNHLKNKAIEDT